MHARRLDWRQRLFVAGLLTLLLGGTAVLGAGAWLLRANSATPSAAPAPIASETTYDEATLSACDHASLANTPDIDFEVSVREARAAREAASFSDVAALREIAVEYRGDKDRTPLDDGYAVAAGYAVSTWCLYHNLTL